MIYLFSLLAMAIPREDVLDSAAEYSTHSWQMGANNQYASCSSSYVSDYTPGQTIIGIPYDWGGFSTISDYDNKLTQGYGAGSHSWHGVLSCTVGVDCSGFVSRAWQTSQKYGTYTIQNVSSTISVNDLDRGDAINKPSSHIVLFAYTSASGLPIHYEAQGGVVFVDSDQGWSGLNGYSAIRYDDIEEGTITGTQSAPIEITSFPYTDYRWTAGSKADVIDYYSCAPTVNESGPEIYYRMTLSQPGTLTVLVSDHYDVDIDIHLLTSPDGNDCLARAHSEFTHTVAAGEYWIRTSRRVRG